MLKFKERSLLPVLYVHAKACIYCLSFKCAYVDRTVKTDCLISAVML